MNWDAIGAIGELLSAVAVLVTLVYLSIQVRSTKEELRRSFLQNRDNATRTIMIEGSANPTLISARNKTQVQSGTRPPGVDELLDSFDLTPEEAQVLAMEFVTWWLYRVETLNNIDLLGPEQKEDFNLHIRLQYGDGAGKVWWDAWKQSLNPKQPIVGYIENVLAGGA